MKTHLRRLLFALCILPFALCLCSCQATKDAVHSFHVFTPTVSATTNDAGDVTLATNYAVAPSIEAGIASARQVTPLIPAPFGSAVDLGLLGLSGILGLIAKIKSKRAALVPVLIRGIEAAGADISAPVKIAVQTEATNSGVQAQLHELVNQLT